MTKLPPLGSGTAGRVAAIFPGQGSQRIGMGKGLYESSAAARAVLDRAEGALPGLLELMWAGPEEELQLTANQQPALVAAGAAAYAAYLEAGGAAPTIAAGHSLGEYTALVAAGVVELEDAVRLVRARGTYMQEAVPEGAGAMIAVLKLETSVIEQLAREVVSAGSERRVVEVANYNAPGQTVLSGDSAGIEEAAARLKEAGGRVVPLKVSAPFHCSLMQPAAERLAADLATTAFADPQFPVVCNVTAAPLAGAADVAGLLTAQVTSSVRWVECVQRLAELAEPTAAPTTAEPTTGVEPATGLVRFLEFGSGEVLVNLVRRILPTTAHGAAFEAKAVYDPTTLEEVLA